MTEPQEELIRELEAKAKTIRKDTLQCGNCDRAIF